MEEVRPADSSQCKVSWLTFSPFSMRAICRAASNSMARPSERIELRFLTSQRVPNSLDPTGRTETLASTRMDPSSMRPSEAPVATRIPRSSEVYARAWAALRRSGSLTISTRGTPARL